MKLKQTQSLELKQLVGVKILDIILQLLSDPLKLPLESTYNLNSVKTVTVSEDFLTLDENIRQCQDMEQYDDCSTKHFVEQLLNACKCLPIEMGTSDKVMSVLDFTKPILDFTKAVLDFAKPLQDFTEPVLHFMKPLLDFTKPILDFT